MFGHFVLFTSLAQMSLVGSPSLCAPLYLLSSVKSLALCRRLLQAIELDPSNYVYHSNRSACYALKGDHAKAKEEAEACIALNPDFIKGYYRYAFCNALSD